jgi:hypothetical protein
MECPVEMVDHESSLIAADWYEEQGMQNWAEGIRIVPILTINMCMGSWRQPSNRRYSRCSSSINSGELSRSSARRGSAIDSRSNSRRFKLTNKSTISSYTGRK